MAVETTDGLTDSQRERRLRVIRAALELSARGGYDAVQMRDVASEAGVALGTIYRYFSSKDHLLVAAMVEWVHDLERRIAARPVSGDSPRDRVVASLDVALRAMEREPQLAKAVVLAQTSQDGAAARATSEVTETMYRVLRSAFPADADPGETQDRIRVLAHVWFSCLVSWTAGTGDLAWVRSEIATAAALLLERRAVAR